MRDALRRWGHHPDVDNRGVTRQPPGSETETWIEGPQTTWEWYVKTGDAEILENTPVSASGPLPSERGPDVCCG